MSQHGECTELAPKRSRLARQARGIVYLVWVDAFSTLSTGDASMTYLGNLEWIALALAALCCLGSAAILVLGVWFVARRKRAQSAKGQPEV